MQLSVLDQSTVVTGRTPADSIRESLELARLAEQLGYARYWVAEHHNTDSQAGSAPEILISAIAATTRHIRVGSAGIMLPHYAALKVAEQFRVLEAIAPGRIDLGLGRAPGSDGRTAFALNPQAATAADQFPAQVRDVLAWVSAEPLPEGHRFRDVRAQPDGPTTPEVWILGSSDYGAQLAAFFGLPYCYAHFITDGRGVEDAIQLYRANFRPSSRLARPHVALCVWALASDTQVEAERLFASRLVWRLGRDRGQFKPLIPPEEAVTYPYTEQELAYLAKLRELSFYGVAHEVGTRLRRLASITGADEIAILTTVHSASARQRSYRLIAAEFGLDGISEAAD